MSPKVNVTPYKTETGKRRYRVRYRILGHENPKQIASFKTLKEARECARWAELELAAGRIPDLGARLAERQSEPTVAEAARAWLETRVDISQHRRRGYERAIERVASAFGDVKLSSLRAQQVAAWQAELERDGLQPGPRHDALSALAQTLDANEIHPNPAAARFIPRPSRKRQSEIMPPSHAHWQVLVDGVTARFRLPLRVLEGTGLRSDELVNLRWGDLDFPASKLRVRGGKTPSARRMVPVPEGLMSDIAALVPREDRDMEAPVFPGLLTGSLREAMIRACRAAGIPVYSPHDLRHRYISLLVKRGMDPAAVAQLAGHTRKSLTLDVYTSVILEDEA